jgi:hypothetical protein
VEYRIVPQRFIAVARLLDTIKRVVQVYSGTEGLPCGLPDVTILSGPRNSYTEHDSLALDVVRLQGKRIEPEARRFNAFVRLALQCARAAVHRDTPLPGKPLVDASARPDTLHRETRDIPVGTRPRLRDPKRR